MTLNQTISRVSTIALAHKQVNRFHKGFMDDFLTDKTNVYPSVLLQDNDGGVSFNGHTVSFNFTLFFFDLVHVSEDARDNEQDVQSDMVSVALDILAQMNHPSYDDWRLSSDNTLKLYVMEDGDMYAGCSVEITISTPYKQNVCEIPSTLQSYTPTSGTRVRVTLDKDLVTGALTLLFSEMPIEYNVPTDQDIIVTDFLKGIVLKTPTGQQGRMTFYKEVTGEINFILTEL